ncbi:protein FRA10AC1-like [Uloborus diversus]|uniref:protein FRA10AC1-like n=1 Tax=Uloborus diversus TaxID=327109 RepID=UPI0024095D5A|nr:protein FRA10AC1-like [Uloborus diversus]
MTEASTSFQVPCSEDYESEFEYDADVGEKRKARQDLATHHVQPKAFKPNRQLFHDECSREQGRSQQQAFLALDAYTRHKKLVNEYVLCYRGSTAKLKRDISNYKTDHDIIRENHRFLWDDEEAYTWGQQLAKKYYDRLFKEYCLCDLSRYKEKKVGMRWRTEKELIVGKGQFFCGNVHCERKDDLNTWEVLFGYSEHGEKKSALVKLRLCERCSDKLHYGYKGKVGLKKKHKKENSKNDSDRAETLLKSTEQGQCDEKINEIAKDQDNIWKQPIREEVEQSKEDAFEEYLEELLL